MKLNEYLNFFLVSQLMLVKEDSETLSQAYLGIHCHIPRIYCKDGFNISIQVGNSNYCGSENGYREFGYEWKQVEWGFPSEHIDAVKYECEQPNTDNTTECVGSCETELIDELLSQHGGIDVAKSLEGFKKSYDNTYSSAMFSRRWRMNS